MLKKQIKISNTYFVKYYIINSQRCQYGDCFFGWLSFIGKCKILIEEIENMKKIACVGIMVCDVIVEPVTNYPQKGLLLPVDSITMHNGGNAMTAAINISKMGGEVSLIGRVGQDMFGEFLKERLVKNGVDVSGVKSAEGAQTSSSVLMIDSVSGERSFFHCVGANGVFNIDDITVHS